MQWLIKKLDSPIGICLILLIMLSPILIYSVGSILYQISSERTPHKYWYMFRDGKRHWELTTADTPTERRNAEAWINPVPLALIWKKDAAHRISFNELEHTVTVIAIEGSRITHVSTIWSTHLITGDMRCREAVILPRQHPNIHPGDHVTITKRHIDCWDY